MYAESIFNYANNIKTSVRNSLDVNTFSSLLKVKSYYLNHENYFADKDELLETNVLFELEEDHHKFYKCYIKGE